VEALQDPGKQVMKTVNGTRQPVTTFPLIQKLCSKIYGSIQVLYNPEGLTKNPTRGRDSLAATVLMARKLTDAVNLDPFFHKYANKGQVYTITNNPVHSGLDIPIKEYQDTILESQRKARASRTPNDGLRLALTMLDPKYRESISLIMSNRKDRIHSDIAGDFVLHFFEHMLTESFSNPQYKPPQASIDRFGDITVEERSMWDPNDPRIFEVTRSATWLADTWKIYVKKRYKQALDRWNKETGGGNGQPWSFVNYCDRDSRWLVAIFLKDVDANYLLAASAGGRMPNHLQMECGFTATLEVSSLEDSSSSGKEKSSSENKNSSTKAAPSIKKREMEKDVEQTKKLKGNIHELVDMVKGVYAGKNVLDGNNSIAVFKTVTEMNRALMDKEALETMSPRTRDKYTNSVQSQRRRLIEHMSELEEKQQQK
jgi:hypothetical protein